jgi:type VI secretion system protein ImpH
LTPLPAKATDFFRLLGLLSRRLPDGASPLGRPGTATPHIALRHSATLGFPTADVSAVHMGANGQPTVCTSFLGLTGTTSPLPEHLTQPWSQDEDSTVMQALFDLWHHRLLTLLFHSVNKYSPAATAHRCGTDLWSQRFLSWAPEADALPLWRRLRWLAHTGQGIPTQRWLLSAVRDLIGAQHDVGTVEVQPMCGSWQPLDAEQYFRLGQSNARLGLSSVLGHHVDAPASAFQLRMGPLSAEAYAHILAPPLRQQLLCTLRLFTPAGIEASIVLQLAPDAHPSWPKQAARLGRNTWVGSIRTATAVRLSPEDSEVRYAV